MKRYLHIYSCFIKQYLKGLITYRTDFLVGMLAFLLDQSLGLFFLYVVFDNIDALAGFSQYEVFLMYGIGQIPKGIDHLIFDNIWIIPRNIREGNMDRYLLRPINPLFSYLIERFQPDAFGEIILGIAISCYCFIFGGIAITLSKTIGLIVLILISVFIFTAVKLITASVSFWLKDSAQLMQISYELNDYTRYPISIFPKPIRFIMTFIIPFALVAYFPSLYLSGKLSFSYVILFLLPVTIVLCLFALLLWNRGLKRYESAGS